MAVKSPNTGVHQDRIWLVLFKNHHCHHHPQHRRWPTVQSVQDFQCFSTRSLYPGKFLSPSRDSEQIWQRRVWSQEGGSINLAQCPRWETEAGITGFPGGRSKEGDALGHKYILKPFFFKPFLKHSSQIFIMKKFQTYRKPISHVSTTWIPQFTF